MTDKQTDSSDVRLLNQQPAQIIASIERGVGKLLHLHHTTDTNLTDDQLEILDDCISKLEEIGGWYW